MRTRVRVVALTWALAVCVSIEAAAQCGMARLPGAGVPGTPVLTAPAGLPSLYFRSDMDVNTDGASRSYHPRDPRGHTLAFNNIANAITAIYDAQGKRIDCEPRRRTCFERYISTFEAARDADWNPVGHPRVETRSIIPWRPDRALGRLVPCTIRDGMYAGYFVSQTSRPVDPSRGDCDQGRYLDSLALSAIVLPRNAAWASQGVVADEFDLVAVRDHRSNQVRFAIVGDRGPPERMGEGTIALTASLSGRRLTGQETYREIKTLRRDDVDYVLFPTVDALKREPGPITAERIDRLGAAAFDQWGGVARLDACRVAPGGAGRSKR